MLRNEVCFSSYLRLSSEFNYVLKFALIDLILVLHIHWNNVLCVYMILVKFPLVGEIWSLLRTSLLS